MDYITVIGTATLASIGTAGIPSVGLVTLTMVFNSVGLPVEAIGIIMGIDRILDMLKNSQLILPVMLFVRPLWLARMGLWIKKCLIKLNKNIGVCIQRGLDSGMHVFFNGEGGRLGGAVLRTTSKSEILLRRRFTVP